MKKNLFICTDLDRTLLPNGAEPESPDAPKLFKNLAQQPWVTLAYVSGRDAMLVQDAIHQYGLPWPDYVISDVGASLYQAVSSSHDSADQEWERNKAWEAIISVDWNGKSNQELRVQLQSLSALRLQEESRQARYKISYYIESASEPGGADRQNRLEQEIRHRLEEVGVRANLIWSYDDMEHVGLLDILPASASKLHAIESLMKQLDFSTSNTVFCGDSGNDMEVLTSCIPSVLVANSHPEVRQLALEGAEQNGSAHALYIASGECMDITDMNGNYSAGMIEGIVHYHPDILNFLQKILRCSFENK